MKSPKATTPCRVALARRSLAAAALAALAACSTGSEEATDPGTASSVVQDLTIDPDGNTIVADLEGISAPLGFGSIVTSGGQNVVDFTWDGTDLIIEFDSRVTPGDQVRFDGVDGVDGGWRDVTTTDPRAPQLGVISAVQDTSDSLLGGDQITAAFIGGARVVEAQVEDISNWTLTVEGVELDLTGTTIAFDPGTQVAGFTLGELANLHANFTLAADLETVAATALSDSPVAATATGDIVPPSLQGANPVAQNLDPMTSGDEFGRVLEIDLDEPVSPVFGASPSNITVVDHPDAVGTTSITRVAVDSADHSILRVVFSRPVVANLDQIMLNGIVDAHGNELSAMTVPIAPGTAAPNAFTTVDFVTQEGVDNDYLTAVTSQALDPDTAALDTRWTLTVGVTPIDLSLQTLTYDYLSRTLTIQLDFDVVNTTTADLSAVGAVDIDGDDFTGPAMQVMAAGDSTSPSVVESFQNRAVDPAGTTVDVSFSEDVDVTSATNTGNYTFTPAIAVNSATIIDGSTVRLDVASPAVPGDVTISVAQAVSDPAGNDLGTPYGPAPMTSTDTTSPSPLGASIRVVEGPANDEIDVLFDDTMIEAEVEAAANWTLESPIGTPVDVTGATIDYDAVTSVATVVLDGGAAPSLLLDRDFELTFATMRDIAGNTIDATAVSGTVDGERNLPFFEVAYIVAGGSGNELVVRFTEPMGRLDDLYDASLNPAGVRYGLTDPMTMATTYPSAAVELDAGLGVQLTYGAAIDPGSTLDIVGLTDTPGNPLFPVLGATLDAEDVTAPLQNGAPVVTAVSGVDNDTITVQFNVPMAAWRLLEPSQYALTVNGGAAVDISGSDFSFDGTDTVTILLDDGASGDLASASTYDIDVVLDPANPLRSQQGVELVATDSQVMVAVGGDNTNGPTQAGSIAMLDPGDPNSIIVVYDESVDLAAALTAADYDYNGGSIALNVFPLTDRAVRVEFAAPVAVANSVEIQQTAAVDTAGNTAAGNVTLAIIDDQTAPTISSTTATIGAGFGGDLVTIEFDEELDPSAATTITNYTVTGTAGTLRVGAAVYVSNDSTVLLYVEDMVDGDVVNVLVDGVSDVAGNLPAVPLADSAIAAGDSTAPTLDSAFVNTFVHTGGLVIDTHFSEPIDVQFAGTTANWSTSGNATVQEADAISSTHVRLLLSEALGATETITLAAGLQDAAGNTQADQTVDPIE